MKRMKLKNVKTFEGFSDKSNSNESRSFYRGDFQKAKDFYKNVIVPACVDCDPMSVVDTLVNDEESDNEDLTQFLHDEFGIGLEKASDIASKRELFMGQLFKTQDLLENERVPNEGKRKLTNNLKASLDRIRGMSDGELMAFLKDNLTSVALKKLMW